MKTSDFDYQLAPERIAQTPIEPRDASRLMVVHRATELIEHRLFHDIGEYLRPGDLLVLNQTRVIAARLFGAKVGTGGRVELLLLKRYDDVTWEALVGGKGLRPGTRIALVSPPVAGGLGGGAGGPAGGRQPVSGTDRPGLSDHTWDGSEPPAVRLFAEIVAETESGGRLVRFAAPVEPLLPELGVVPLPPYIHVPLADPERYQTVYGRVEGSAAASTAGLHFTPELLLDLRSMGVELAFITLHIGLDTFRPVKEERVEDHQIHCEWYELEPPVAEQINRARLEGRRVIAVGTTVVRALESAARGGTGRQDSGGEAPGEPACVAGGPACGWKTVSAYAGPTELFIYPGHSFRVVEAMVTNFHLPRSSLLLLVSAFAGRDLIFRAYQEADSLGYRFFSFGDAMLLL